MPPLLEKDFAQMVESVRVKGSITPSIEGLSGFTRPADKGKFHGILHQTSQT